MLKELLKPEIKELVEKRRWADLKDVLSTWAAPEIADLLLDIDKADRVLIFRVLDLDLSTDVFSHLESDECDSLINDLTDHETRELLTDMSPDDRTGLLEELPAKVTRRLLNLLSPEDLKEARFLLGYPEDSTGRLMTPDFVAIRSNWTVARALQHIREFGRDSETIYRIYVTDDKKMLIDDILLKNIILANETTVISELMDNTVISAGAFDDQEDSLRLMEKYDISALPVVDSSGHLLGIVTFDDIMDVSAEEATEDFQKISGINPVDQSYLSASVGKLLLKRFPWLFILLVSNFFTVFIMANYHGLLNEYVVLTFFVPLLIGTAGNTGTQSATLIIRSLATGDVELSDWGKIFRKEMLIGSLLGLSLGAISFIRGFYDERGGIGIALVVSTSMLFLVVWANIIGALLPLVIARFKLDPAVISSPFIATLIDVSGIIIYCEIAMMFLDFSV
ncbi:MAG: magnesium transporter [Chlorobi bacterium]|nr:magnesium transporter [Chlorobiota bacterium]